MYAQIYRRPTKQSQGTVKLMVGLLIGHYKLNEHMGNVGLMEHAMCRDIVAYFIPVRETSQIQARIHWKTVSSHSYLREDNPATAKETHKKANLDWIV